jgi:hypothetical protein
MAGSTFTINFTIFNVTTTYIMDATIIHGITPPTTLAAFLTQINAGPGRTVQVVLPNGTLLASGANVGTGMTMQVLFGTTVIFSRTIIIYGDVNGDGLIDSNDSRIIRYVSLGLQTLSGPYALAGNVNHDTGGLINNADYLKIRNYLNGIGTITQ